MHRLTDEQLVALAEGRLPPAEAAALRARVAADSAALAELAAIEELLTLTRDDSAEDAPEHVIARAVRLMRPLAPSPEPGLLRRIVAILHSDSLRQPLGAGLRSEQAASRSLAYSADEWDFDLQIAPRAGRWQLRGQVLGPAIVGSVALSGPDTPLDAPINELGEFSLPPVEAGTYALLVRLGTREILIADLELGPFAPQS